LLISHLREESGINLISDLDPTVKAEPSTELLLYQIAREALTNTLKHSGARAVWIGLRQGGGTIALWVEDDGSGFDLRDATDDRHFGVELMRQRATVAGGSLELRTSPGNGTLVSLRVPVHSPR
jgi:NarL family two-component system sensor histidine kinase LiaS